MRSRSFFMVLAAVTLAFQLTALCAEKVRNFGVWEKEISAFERNDTTNPPPKDALLFVGSSTIRLWTNLQTVFPKQPIINRGFGGSQIVDATHFADRIIFPYKPKAIFFRSGGNDLAAGKSAEQVFGDYQDFVKTVRAKLPDTPINFISWSPSISRWKQAGKEKALNDMVKKFTSENKGLVYIETYEISLGPNGEPRPELFRADKLHFSPEGYKLLAERVRPYVEK